MANEEPVVEEEITEVEIDEATEDKDDNEEIIEAKADVNPNVEDQLENVSDEPNAEDDKESEEEYSKRVQKRVDSLTYKIHEAERREKAAVDYAQGVQQENLKLKSKQEHQDGVFINEHKGRIEAQLETAKRQYKEAYQQEDPELIAEANQNIARYAAELTQAEQTEVRFKRHVATNPAVDAEVKAYEPPPDPNAPARSQGEPDPKATAWAEKNTWFGDRKEMTNAALQIHNKLVQDEGYIANGETYYEELDARMRKNFPKYFKKPKLSATSNVVGGNNTPISKLKGGKKVVNLTASQVSIARKLGLTLEQYAKYVP